MAESRPRVSVIVPHYNDLSNLVRCLASLRAQRLAADSYEVIVADNNSACGLERVREVAGGARVVHAAEQGAGPARNAGAAAAHGEVFAFIDSDCMAAPEWLVEGCAALDRFDYVGGQVKTSVADLQRMTPAEAYEAVFAFDFRKYIEKDKFSGTGNLFVPRSVFEKVGGFRAGVSEDMEWCRRANALGFRLGYAERAIVSHPARRDWSELRKKWDRIVSERLLLAREAPRWRLRWTAYALAVFLSPLTHVPTVLFTPRITGVNARTMALCGLFQVRWYRACMMMAALVRSSEAGGKTLDVAR